MNDATYFDGNRPYLELHARHAPIAMNGYYTGMDEADVENETLEAVARFEADNGIELVFLGRSGRHCCIEDTPRNRRRFASLQSKAEKSVQALFESWKNSSRAPA